MKRPPIPTLDKTQIPMPDKIMDNRSFREPKPQEVNPWDKWIQGLEIGQSFIIANYHSDYVKRKAKEFDLDIVWREGPDRHTKRMWIYGTKEHRNPIYRQITSTKLIEVHLRRLDIPS